INRRCTGEAQDTTGLLYLRARYYDPTTGRFLTRDPVPCVATLPQTLNPYAYALNNPVLYTDPSGEFAFIPLLLVAAAGGFLGGVSYYGIQAYLEADPCTEMDWRWQEALFWGGGGTGMGAVIGTGIYGGWWVGTQLGWWGVGGSLYSFERAAEFGIRSYNDLRSAISGTGLQAHHIIEQRFAARLGLNPGQMQSVALTPEEHQIFTNLWRAQIGYNVDYTLLTANDIWLAAQQVYAGYPELLEAARRTLFGP
ncbi:MAG TPA: RHS repeat-associated core domain-containing protein, partial [Chloroflexi bacterium]|nr:RHS repeat-associated core domain-containing protein [Chloroflexota bacterium]